MGGMDPQDLFSQLFGGGGGFFGGGGPGGGRGGRPQGPRKGKDLVHRIKVSLEDLYKGKTSKLALQKHVLCGKCKGKGGKEGAVKTCGSCKGQGVKIVLRQLGPMVQQIQQPCNDCNGEGEIINAKDRCKDCNGKKNLGKGKKTKSFKAEALENDQGQTYFELSGNRRVTISTYRNNITVDIREVSYFILAFGRFRLCVAHFLGSSLSLDLLERWKGRSSWKERYQPYSRSIRSSQEVSRRRESSTSSSDDICDLDTDYPFALLPVD